MNEFLKSLQINIAVETGTNQAKTTRVLAQHFERVYSIELSETLFQTAESMTFPGRERVEFVLGDSADWVERLAREIEDSCFWYLDAHFCHITGHEATSDFPLWRELEAIKARDNRSDVIWIDDVHTFGKQRPDLGQPWEGVTVEAIEQFMPDCEAQVVGDGLVLRFPV